MLGLLSRNTFASMPVAARLRSVVCASVSAGGGSSAVKVVGPVPFERLANPSVSVSSSVHCGSFAQPFSSTGGTSTNADDSDEEEEDTGSDAGHPPKLEALDFKNYDVGYLKIMEERGELELQPFYQRGYKWSEKQASIWIESILQGYPCLPEITLLRTVNEDGEEKFAVFDGQQRLSSTMFYVGGRRSQTWPVRKIDNDSFRLKQLPVMKDYEGKRFKDLPKRQQNAIMKFNVRCAIIPSSWSMSAYCDFFKRIQGGGTPMTDHELRRALSRGPFTDLLDELSIDDVVKKALSGCKGLKPDDTQQLLLRYFQFNSKPHRFGKPTLAQNGLETMKKLNREMEAWTGEDFYKRGELVDPLKKSLELIVHVFHQNEPFRRPVPLVKGGAVLDNDKLDKIWFDSNKLRAPIWDCTVAAFACEDIVKSETAVRDNADAIRNAVLELMQTEPAFTETLRSSEISARVRLLETEILRIIDDAASNEPAQISSQVRKDLIQSAKKDQKVCSLCKQSLSNYEEHLHVDHIKPRSKGGTNELGNLQVVHKTCNLRKSNKTLELAGHEEDTRASTEWF